MIMNTVALPVMIETNIIQEHGMTIYVPVIYGLSSRFVEHKINQKIYMMITNLITEQYQEQNTTSFSEMLGTYEIKTNERNILSISFSNYAIFTHAAHGLTIMKSLTFNVETGDVYQLEDLFKDGSNYIEVLSDNIQKQIKERDITLLGEFNTIRPDQDFYIADKVLVLYFQLYEITPYVVGFPMFPISVFELEDIMAEDGPLARMATNS